MSTMEIRLTAFDHFEHDGQCQRSRMASPLASMPVLDDPKHWLVLDGAVPPKFPFDGSTTTAKDCFLPLV